MIIDFRRHAFLKGYNIRTVVRFNGLYVTLEQYNELIVDPRKIEFFKGLVMSVETQEAYWKKLKPSKAPMLKNHPISHLKTPTLEDQPEHISSCIQRFMGKRVEDLKYDWDGENA
jgi:hypothetical protein